MTPASRSSSGATCAEQLALVGVERGEALGQPGVAAAAVVVEHAAGGGGELDDDLAAVGRRAGGG